MPGPPAVRFTGSPAHRPTGPSGPSRHGPTPERAHVRSGDSLALAAYLGGNDRFDRALAEFAQSYADRNERDGERRFEAPGAACRSGRIRAERHCGPRLAPTRGTRSSGTAHRPVPSLRKLSHLHDAQSQ